jgi:dTDP-4-dehydrorhamnose 3,5-epimerase
MGGDPDVAAPAVKRELAEMDGVVLSVGAAYPDERGAFSKLLNAGAGEEIAVTQIASSYNARSGTVRGMHLQVPPHGEIKRLWCAIGAIWDVLVDFRPESRTFGDWAGVRLSPDEPALLTVPMGVAHGFQTLVDATTVVYLIDGAFLPDHGRTLRWDDPTVGIDWPLPVTAISESDRSGRAWPVS